MTKNEENQLFGMAGVNKVILLGRLGKDPEIKTFNNGGKICNLVIATSESYTDREGQKVEKTEWHNVVMQNSERRKLADLCEMYLSKGSQLYLEGKLQTRNYQDTNGVTKYITEIIGANMNFIGGNRQEGSNASPNPPNNTSNSIQQNSASMTNHADTFPSGGSDEDDLPF